MSLLLRPLLFLSLFVLPLCTVAVVHGGAVLGGWTPITNLNDPYVREIAEFAVTEYSKISNGGNLTLQRAIKGWTQVVDGTNYRLLLAAKIDLLPAAAPPAEFMAVVLDKPREHSRKLVSFDRYQVVGAWKPIQNVSDTRVRKIAEFAVAAYDKKHGAKLRLERVIKAETQVVNGVKYRLVLTAKNETASSPASKYETVVYEIEKKPRGHLRKLELFKPLKA